MHGQVEALVVGQTLSEGARYTGPTCLGTIEERACPSDQLGVGSGQFVGQVGGPNMAAPLHITIYNEWLLWRGPPIDCWVAYLRRGDGELAATGDSRAVCNFRYSGVPAAFDQPPGVSHSVQSPVQGLVYR